MIQIEFKYPFISNPSLFYCHNELDTLFITNDNQENIGWQILQIIDDDIMIIDKTTTDRISDDYYILPNFNAKKWVYEKGTMMIWGVNAYGKETNFMQYFKSGDIFSVELGIDSFWYAAKFNK